MLPRFLTRGHCGIPQGACLADGRQELDMGLAGKQDGLLPAGQAGKVVVRGPDVMYGYPGRPQESAQTARRMAEAVTGTADPELGAGDVASL